eukprot:TRINITY_DN14434_c0_g1_i1.p1 TRINITY_DN14434_c0_g1~~TRINITY_DN14434_c0_g1_i1.p1  ORF type:complete len:446 (+),score=82.47 TRINITY_DN14434_c0_g1_i1:150-1340(+)
MDIDASNEVALIEWGEALGFRASFRRVDDSLNSELVEQMTEKWRRALDVDPNSMDQFIEDSLATPSVNLGNLLRAATHALKKNDKRLSDIMTRVFSRTTATHAILDMTFIDDASLDFFSANMGKKVTVLSLDGVTQVSAAAVVRTAKQCPKLTKFVLPFVHKGENAKMLRDASDILPGSKVILAEPPEPYIKLSLSAGTKELSDQIESLLLKVQMFGLGSAGEKLAKREIRPEFKLLSGDELLNVLKKQQKPEDLIDVLMAYCDLNDQEYIHEHANTVIPLLKHSHDDVRVWAVIACMKIGNSLAVRPMLDRLEGTVENDRFVKESICIAMARFKSAEAVDYLIQLWRNCPISNVRQAAEVSLKKIGGPVVQDAFSSAAIIREQMENLLSDMQKGK